MYLKSPRVDIIKVRGFGRFHVYFRYHGTPTHSKSRQGIDSSLALQCVRGTCGQRFIQLPSIVRAEDSFVFCTYEYKRFRKKHVYKCLTYVLQRKNIHSNESTCTFLNTSYKETKHSLLENVPDSFLASLGCPKEHHITSVFARTSTRKEQYVVLRVYFVRPENVVNYDSVDFGLHTYLNMYLRFFTQHTVFMLDLCDYRYPP